MQMLTPFQMLILKGLNRLTYSPYQFERLNGYLEKTSRYEKNATKKRKRWIERDDLYLRKWPAANEKEFDERAWLKGRPAIKKSSVEKKTDD